MPRLLCYKSVFYKVFCAVTALSLTVILTNVFCDEFRSGNSESTVTEEDQNRAMAYNQVESKRATFDFRDDAIEHLEDRGSRSKRLVGTNMLMEDMKFFEDVIRNITLNKLIHEINAMLTMKMNEPTKIKETSFNKIVSQHKINKRQIRIVTMDNEPNDFERSVAENIYLDDVMFSEQDSTKDVDTPPDSVIENKEEQYIYYTHSNEDDSKALPRLLGTVGENPLMSKYPHIFPEESPKLENIHSNINIFANIFETEFQKDATTTQKPVTTFKQIAKPGIWKVIKEISELPSNNYKLTVKVFPKSSKQYRSKDNNSNSSSNKTNNNKSTTILHSLVNDPGFINSENRSITTVNGTEIISSLENDFKNKSVETMQKILREQRDKIDKQLDELEKASLEPSLSKENKFYSKNNDSDEFLDISLPLNPPQVLHLRKNEIGKLVSSVLLNAQNVTHVLNMLSTTTVKNSNVSPYAINMTLSTNPTTESTAEPTAESYDARSEETIKMNENLTSNILEKIKQNTELLQKFLQKLSDKFETSTKKTTYIITDRPKITETQMLENNPDTWYRYYDPFQDYFQSKNIRDLNVQRNNKNRSTPFVFTNHIPWYMNYKDTEQLTLPEDSKINTRAIINNTKSKIVFSDATNNTQRGIKLNSVRETKNLPEKKQINLNNLST